MTFANFYFVCFIVGVSLCLLSFVFSGLHLHLPVKLHVPAGGHSAAGAHGLPHGMPRAGIRAHGSALAWLNPPAMFAFLAWFGGVGFLLMQYYNVWYLLALAIAALAGCTGAAICSWFLLKVLLPRETVLQDSDYELVGVIGRMNTSVREGGTGEIIFSQCGVRRCAGARATDGKALEKGREVVIERVDRGIAYVAPWEEFTKTGPSNS
jgi:hypothetical protein